MEKNVSEKALQLDRVLQNISESFTVEDRLILQVALQTICVLIKF